MNAIIFTFNNIVWIGRVHSLLRILTIYLITVLYCCICSNSDRHRRRIETEGKARVLSQSIWKKRLNSTISFKTTKTASSARSLTNSAPQKDATTFVLPSVSILLLWWQGSVFSRVGHVFFSKERNVLAFFCVLYNRTQRSLHSFAFFIKACSVLCVLLGFF